MNLSAEQAAVLVAAAAGGDRRAWESLVESYGRLVWSITRDHRLSPGDAADVSQTTWLRLLEHIDRLAEPGRVGSWLATTARRECLRALGRRKRTSPVGDDGVFEAVAGRPGGAGVVGGVDDGLLSAERVAAVRAAVASLPAASQQMIELMMAEDSPSYEKISAQLGRPVGSLGPSRRRCLDKLRTILIEADIELGELIAC
jgi:RNA polymerase sigma factor (sigma-70 family)